MTDWPGDTAPLPHQAATDRLGPRFAGLVGTCSCGHDQSDPPSPILIGWFDAGCA